MKNKIKKILSTALKSAYDGGNIDDGGILGGDNAVDQLYDLFVDEATFVRHLENPDVVYPPEKKVDKKSESLPLYHNPKTGKPEKLFGTLIPVFTVCCTNDNLINGYKGCAIYYTIQAYNEQEAKEKALKNKEFTKHFSIDPIEERYLTVFKPTGNYKIGEVKYFEGDERL